MNAIDRFMKYIRFDTQSDEESDTCPSTGKQKVLGVRKIAEGDVNSASIVTRKLVEAALSLNAARVILAHNHVSGLALPSRADQASTAHFQSVFRQVGVVLADHVIFSDDDMVSMLESGYFRPEEIG